MEETEKEGVRELFAVVVKLLLTRSVCCLVYGQRKESCNVGVSTEHCKITSNIKLLS